jgi:hypothetical protein
MTDCVFCGEPHPQLECPLFGKTEDYLGRYAPAPPDANTPPEEPSSSSLPPTQFEQIYGKEAEPLLMDVLDGPDEFRPEQRELALLLASGEKKLEELTGEERDILNGITHRMAYGTPPPPKPAIMPRPAGVHTQFEMENFENEFMPPADKRDWPISPDDPEGQP